MRNGIYRVWLKGAHGDSSGAAVFKDGEIFAVNPLFAFNGSYSELGGWLKAEVFCKRLSQDLVSPNLPDLDAFHLKLQGLSGGEFAQLSGTIDEVPSFKMTFEYAYLCEV